MRIQGASRIAALEYEKDAMDNLCLTLSQQHKALSQELQLFDNTNQDVRQTLDRGGQVSNMKNRMNQDLYESRSNLERISPEKYNS